MPVRPAAAAEPRCLTVTDVDAVRIDGWESRLAGVIESAANTPYALGVHDCLRIACAAEAALTGVDRWPQWAGRYATRADCYRLLREYAGRQPSAASRQPPVDSGKQSAASSQPSVDSGQLAAAGLQPRHDGVSRSVFERAFSWFFGCEPASMHFARRGDIVAYTDGAGEKHLGVCNGAQVAVLGEHGMRFVPRSACDGCWRIG